MAAIRVWALHGGAWRAAILTGLGKNRRDLRVVLLSFGCRRERSTRYASDLYSYKRKLKGKADRNHRIRSAFMKKAKVGAARAPAKKAPATRKSSTTARSSGAESQGQLLEILERLARSTERLARAAEQIAQALPRSSGVLEDEQPHLLPDEMPATPEQIVGVMVADESENEMDDGEGEEG